MNIGQNIRNYRERKGLSLSQVAEMTDFTIGYLSQIERSIANPSINSLQKISQALGIQMAYFFVEDEDSEAIEERYITRADKRKMLAYPDSKTKIYLLSPGFLDNEIALLMIVAQPGAKSAEDFHIHGDAEQCGTVIKGTLSLELNGSPIELKEGDSFQFKSSIAHGWENKGRDISISIWAIVSSNYANSKNLRMEIKDIIGSTVL